MLVIHVLDYGIIWIKVCREVIHMENVYKGLRHTGFIMMLIFGGVFYCAGSFMMKCYWISLLDLV